MSTLLIEGGHRLQGRVAVEGNKNAALPLLAACLLTSDECVLTNVPRISDVEVTALLAAARAAGTTDIRHAAAEPHVVELCQFLRKMGAEVSGEGSSRIRITGTTRLHGAAHRLGGDYIEAGSWAVVAAITGGEV